MTATYINPLKVLISLLTAFTWLIWWKMFYLLLIIINLERFLDISCQLSVFPADNVHASTGKITVCAYVSKLNMERMKQVYSQLAHYRRTGQVGSNAKENSSHTIFTDRTRYSTRPTKSNEKNTQNTESKSKWRNYGSPKSAKHWKQKGKNSLWQEDKWGWRPTSSTVAVPFKLPDTESCTSRHEPNNNTPTIPDCASVVKRPRILAIQQSCAAPSKRQYSADG